MGISPTNCLQWPRGDKGAVKGQTMSDWNPERVRALRAALGESQREFARHFRVTVDSVRTWEQGKGLPGGPSTVILDLLQERIAVQAHEG